MKNETFVTQYKNVRPIYKKLTTKISLILEELLEIKSSNYHAITSRVKTIDSFSEKIKKPKYHDPLNELTDLAGIRVIGYVEKDVEDIAEIIKESFEIDPQNSLDKSLELGVDKVGYKSVHYVCKLPKSRSDLPEYERFKYLKFEIQIRTILQHAWAEIEHDRNYKFSGELPSEIQRRFKLVAGSLELADREFNQLSIDIDNYSKKIEESIEKENLDIDLNSTALKQFLITKFEDLVRNNIIIPDFNGSENEIRILEELRNFGIETLSDLNGIIDERIIDLIKSEGREQNGNFLGLLRSVMMASDADKYFLKSFERNWAVLSDGDDVILIQIIYVVFFIYGKHVIEMTLPFISESCSTMVWIRS